MCWPWNAFFIKGSNDWREDFQTATIFSGALQMTCGECFCVSWGLYWLSNLINKASEICLLFIFPGLGGFAGAGKLPFSGTIFPRRCSAFLLFLMESDEHSQGTHCYPLARLQQKVKEKIVSQLWQLSTEIDDRCRLGVEDKLQQFHFTARRV